MDILSLDILSQQTWIYILADILKELRYLPIALLAGLFTGSITALFSRRKIIIHSLFSVYVIMLLIITIYEREPGSRTGISLALFETMGNSRANAFVIENILLFIPFGLFAPRMWKCMRRLPLCISAGFMLSLMIEIVQLITERGHFQVDDILMNTIGAAIGAVAARITGAVRIHLRRQYYDI